MKCILFFYLLCVSALTNYGALAPKTVSVPTNSGHLNLTLYINNAQDARSNNSTTVTNTQSTAHLSAKTSLGQVLTEIDLKNKLSSLNNSLFSYKWHLLAGSLAFTYAALCYTVVSGNSYLGQAELWSSWRQDLSLDQLLSIPQEQFAQELLQEIHRRYTNSDTISNLTTPLSLFLLALEKEEEQIKWYQSTYAWLTYLRIAKAIPFSKVKFGKVNERLQRIAYLKNAFHTWIAKFHYEQPRDNEENSSVNLEEFELE